MRASITETSASVIVDLCTGDRRRMGGKAASLARAAAAGHRVPAGLVVTTDARGVESVRGELDARIGALGEGPFAVRSSALVEDGASRSFAGQLETELSVPRGEVLHAIERCWASAAALRAMRYAGGEVGPVAVIVQRMVPADAAGVAFSADARTGERGVVVIEAVRGLGDRLVSGSVDPEGWRACGQEKCERVRTCDAPVLTSDQAQRVAQLARDLEALFGCPQDVEWALANDELHLLQSRPITALPAAPVPIPVEVPEGDWERDDHHGVLSPLGWAWFQPYPRAMGELMKQLGMPLQEIQIRRIGGHLYQRLVMAGGGGDKMPPRWLLWLVMRVLPSARRGNRFAAEMLDGEKFLEHKAQWESTWRPELQREIATIDVPRPESLSDEELLSKIDAAMKLSARGLELHALLGGVDLFGVGKLALFIEDHLGWKPSRVYELLAGASSATTELHRQIEEIVSAHEDEVRSLERAPRTWAALHRGCPRLGAALADWLVANRLRVLHYDPKHATLGERPEIVLSMVDAVIESRATQPHGERAQSPVDQAALLEARERLTPALRAELDRLIEIGRGCYGVRDANGVETVSRPAGLLRHFVLELGRRVPAIAEPEHAVYLDPEEHAPALRGELPDLAQRIEERRGQESWACFHRGPRSYGNARAPMPPTDVFPDAMARMMRIFAFMEEAEKPSGSIADGDVLRGAGLGVRVVTAKARVIDRPEQLFTLRQGEVLVCRITSPEWSVALGRAAAIVTNEGGALSHPAIIAREYGIPAVLGTETATRRIATGDSIRVDPAAGTVEILRV